MTEIPSTYHSQKTSLSLFLITLLLGVFVFSGEVFYVSLQLQKGLETGQLFSKKSPFSKQSIPISYKKAFEQTPLTRYLDAFKKYPTMRLSFYHNLCKVKIDHVLRQTYSFTPVLCFFPQKTIPQSSSIEAFLSPSMR